jgi:hypothetical protein
MFQNLNPQLFPPHSKVLITEPSPRVMTKNDIAKYRNTYFEQKSDFLNITIWFN